MDVPAALALALIMFVTYCFVTGNLNAIYFGLAGLFAGLIYRMHKDRLNSATTIKSKSNSNNIDPSIRYLDDIPGLISRLRYKNIDFQPRIDGTRSQQLWAVQTLVFIAAFFVCVRFNASVRFDRISIYTFLIAAFLIQFVVRRSVEGTRPGHRYWLTVIWFGTILSCAFFALVTITLIRLLEWSTSVSAYASAIFVTFGFFVYQISLPHNEQKPFVFGLLLSILGAVLLSGDLTANVILCLIYANVALAIISIVLTILALERKMIPWTHLFVGSTVLPFFVAWISASVATTAFKSLSTDRVSPSQDKQGRLETFAARKRWADLTGWQTPDHQPLTIAVALSGGGYRAAVIHAGFLSALDERCVPVRYLSAVSGGSIFGSFYALGYPPGLFAQRLRSEPPGLPDDFLAIWNVFTNWVGKRNSADVYSEHFETVFFGSKTLSDTDIWPQLLVNATDIERTADAREVFFKDRNREFESLNKTLISDIVAASGAFPGVFQPKEIPWPLGDRNDAPIPRRFVDGGVVENLGYTGINRFIAISNNIHMATPVPTYVIISDASAEGATGKLPPKVELMDLLSRSQDISFNFQESLIRKTLSGTGLSDAHPLYLFVRALDKDILAALKQEFYPNAHAENKMEGSKIAEEVARYSTLRELDPDQVDKAFWLGRAMGEIRWRDIDRWRRTYTNEPNCGQ